MTGTNIGGWLVLEPWITPSFFYRFLGKTKDEGVGMDCWSVCESLGPVEGNKLMRAHWDAWFTENDIKNLADRGVEIVRLPIGDWTLEQYGPYVGCMDGAAEYIDWMYDVCEKYGIKVLLDVHAMKGSQNGFDNSGQTSKVEWKDENNFSHWPNAQANWMGEWNIETNKYDSINYDNINWSIDNSEKMLLRWGQHPAFYAFEPVNEPWWNSDGEVLFDFYRKVRKLVQKHTPKSYFVFHNMFVYSNDWWNQLFADDDTELVAMDHHYYQAWNQGMTTTKQFCDDYEGNSANADGSKYEVWFGEWSLATDVCAHWLGGFNDGNTDPQFKCKWVDCPKSYLPEEFGADFDRTAAVLGPHGTGNQDNVAIHNGKCSTDSEFFSHAEVETIARCALDSYDRHVNATFLWTAKNEIEEKWDYVRAWDLGWINKTALSEEKENNIKLIRVNQRDSNEMHKLNFIY